MFNLGEMFMRPNGQAVLLQDIAKIAAEYMALIPEEVQNSATFRDRLKEDSLLQQQEKFKIRGEHEREAIMLACCASFLSL